MLLNDASLPRGFSVAWQADDDLPAVLADPQVLAVFRFGLEQPATTDLRVITVGLANHDTPVLEVWRSTQPVQCLPLDNGRLLHNDQLHVGCITLDEPDGTDIAEAARLAYRQLTSHLSGSPQPHLLRIWNYLDQVTDGDGDGERYRRFCVGRVAGMGQLDLDHLPAATCIGRHDGVRRLQVYWLASRHPGLPLENPRQLSAWRYPRQYGPQSPTFARALLPAQQDSLPLLISGTAAIVGHQSLHHGNLRGQLEETLANLRSLIQVARQQRPDLPPDLGIHSPLKVYVRHASDLPDVAALLDTLLPADVPRLLLHGEVCRRELLVEIEAMHG